MGGYQVRGAGLALSLCVLCGLLVLTGCGSAPPAVDLARNDDLYRSPEYRAPKTLDQTVFVSPVVDERPVPQPKKTAKTSTTVFMPDSNWHRPPAVMVNDILRRELQDGAVYRRFVDRAEDADIVVEPKLVMMHGAMVRFIGRSNIFAETGLSITVRGRRRADGERPVLLQKVFEHTVDSGGRGGVHVPTLAGMALNRTMRAALPAIYAASAGGGTQQPF